MEFKKVLLYKNQQGINSDVSRYQLAKEYFQSYVNKIIDLGFEVEENDIQELFENPKAYIAGKITKDKVFELGGLTITKENVFNLIEKPTGTIELINKIEADKKTQHILEYKIFKIKSFRVVDNIVELTVEFMELIISQNAIYIETENQQNAIIKVRELVSLLNEINELAVNKFQENTELSELVIQRNNVFELKNEIVNNF